MTPDERAVIRARATGWEKATPALLAAVFGADVRGIRAVLRGCK